MLLGNLSAGGTLPGRRGYGEVSCHARHHPAGGRRAAYCHLHPLPGNAVKKKANDRGRVLVACPTYAGKQYALDAWIEAYKSFDYPNSWAYQVDNTTGTLAYFETLKAKGLKVTHLEP